MRFQLAKIVSETGTVSPSCSSTKLPGVAAANGPDPE
jgi:hypothetical protein